MSAEPLTLQKDLVDPSSCVFRQAQEVAAGAQRGQGISQSHTATACRSSEAHSRALFGSIHLRLVNPSARRG